jgi:hypothetical protein
MCQETTQEYLKANGFKVGEKFQKYWYYMGPDYNSEKRPDYSGSGVHNCGAYTWVQYMIDYPNPT